MSAEKQAKLLELAKKRQTESLPPHLNLTDLNDGYYECDHVTPWTKSAFNVNASVMLIGQDWSSTHQLNQPKDREQKLLGQKWNLPTNRNLRELLQTNLHLCFCQTYATNLFPFIKNGPMHAAIPAGHMHHCALKYALPQINIVKPDIVICLGKATFDAIRYALDQPPLDWSDAAKPYSHTIYEGSEIYGLPHSGSRGIANAGGMQRVHLMWQNIASQWNSIRSPDGAQRNPGQLII